MHLFADVWKRKGSFITTIAFEYVTFYHCNCAQSHYLFQHLAIIHACPLQFCSIFFSLVMVCTIFLSLIVWSNIPFLRSTSCIKVTSSWLRMQYDRKGRDLEDFAVAARRLHRNSTRRKRIASNISKHVFDKTGRSWIELKHK